jgi:hypothetical protein
MDEHLVMFMVIKSNTPSGNQKQQYYSGERKDVEFKLLEFLYSLRYYHTRWLRAKMYAELAGFLKVESNSHI